MDPHGEHAGDGVRRSHDVRHHAVPHAGGVLRTGDRLVCAAAPAVEIAIGAVSAVHLGRHDPRELRRCRVDSVASNGGIKIAGERLLRRCGVLGPAHIRLHPIGAARETEADVAGRSILAGLKLVGRLEEPSLVLFFRREVEGEPGTSACEPAVNIAMGHRGVPHLVDVDIEVFEPRDDTIGGHQHGCRGRWGAI